MSKIEKDRIKAQQEKFQAILSSLLKDDDNKYCVDCDAKGPRWASWNLGVFLCIRCAGIHRKMGVHVSKVKSVNLDTWTAEQVAMMQEVGNSRARAAYEAELPNNFRRPQTDSALENFIRTKYEQKKYLAREWIPPKPVVPKEIPNEWLEDEKDKKKNKPKSTSTVQLNSSSASIKTKPPPAEKKPSEDNQVKPNPPKVTPNKTSAVADLIGLDASSSNVQPNGDLLADIFGSSDSSSVQNVGSSSNKPQPVQSGEHGAGLLDNGSSDGKGSEKNTKDSILALYGNTTSQQQMFGVPGGMYMPQQNIYGMVPGTTMGPQPMIGQPAMTTQPAMPTQPGMQGMMPQQPGMIRMQQPNIYGMGQVGTMPGAVMGQPNMVMPPQGNTFNPQQQMQQQLQYQQMQQQMAAMKLAGGPVGATVGVPPVMGGQSWMPANSGQTLSNNLWQ